MVDATNTSVSVRPLRESDLLEAARIMRLAWGTFLGLPDFSGLTDDSDYLGTRWLANPGAGFVAEGNGKLVGSNFAISWGSVGFIGPLSVRPDLWNRGIGTCLMRATMKCFAKWGTKHVGLSTFAHSPAQVHLYEKFGFWPRFLSVIMSKPVIERPLKAQWSRFSALSEDNRRKSLAACRELSNTLYEGLSLEGEISMVDTMKLGDTMLLWNGPTLVGFAVCHWGAGTEAGSGTFYIRFGAVRPGPEAVEDFQRLLEICEAMAVSQDLQILIAGQNMARHEAYHVMRARGFRITESRIAMDRPNEPTYNRPGVYIMDSWR